jgi:putative transposase
MAAGFTQFWSPSYCAVTCGGAPLEVVKAYIEDQRRPPSKRGAAQSDRIRKTKFPA